MDKQNPIIEYYQAIKELAEQIKIMRENQLKIVEAGSSLLETLKDITTFVSEAEKGNFGAMLPSHAKDVMNASMAGLADEVKKHSGIGLQKDTEIHETNPDDPADEMLISEEPQEIPDGADVKDHEG